MLSHSPSQSFHNQSSRISQDRVQQMPINSQYVQSQVSNEIDDIKKNMHLCQTSLEFSVSANRARAKSNYNALLFLNAANPNIQTENR